MFSVIQLTSTSDRPNASGDLTHESGCSVRGDDGEERGVFGSWNWDGSTFRLTTDTFGYLPYYYHHHSRSGNLVVSDSPQGVASTLDQVTFDPLALGFFCRAGFMIGNRTLYGDVNRVPPNSTITWTSDSFSITTNPLAESESPRSPAEAIDGFVDRFEAAMDARSAGLGEFIMPLSAGRDSRMMLLSLVDRGVIPQELITIGSNRNVDVQIARDLGKRLNLPFRQINRNPGSWLEVERQRHRMCGFEALEHSWLIPLWDHLSGRGASWFDGLGCGAILRNEVNDRTSQELLATGDVRRWCRSFFSRTAAPSEDWIVRIQACAPMSIAGLDEAVDLFAEEMTQHLDKPNPITSFTFHNWGRRSIALNPFGICRGTRCIGVPFMDRNLVNWCLSVPGEWCLEHDIQTAACHRLFPSFRDLPFQLDRVTNHNSRTPASRLRNYLEKRRFFMQDGACFRSLYQNASDNPPRGPHFSRVVTLMTHLALAERSHASTFDMA